MSSYNGEKTKQVKKKFTSDDYSASNTAMTLNNYNQANFFGILNSDKPENNIDRIKQILKNPLTEKINLEVKQMIRSYFKELIKSHYRNREVVVEQKSETVTLKKRETKKDEIINT